MTKKQIQQSRSLVNSLFKQAGDSARLQKAIEKVSAILDKEEAALTKQLLRQIKKDTGKTVSPVDLLTQQIMELSVKQKSLKRQVLKPHTDDSRRTQALIVEAAKRIGSLHKELTATKVAYQESKLKQKMAKTSRA